MDNSGQVGSKVLDFYQECPFNVYSAPALAAESILADNQIAQIYQDLDKVLRQPQINSILDVGCGGGWFSLSAAKFYNLKVTGIDFNPSVVEFAKDTATAAGLKVDFRAHNIFEISSLNRTFDVVASIGVLHHTHNTEAALHAISGLVATTKEARLYIGLYHLHGRKPFLEYFDRLRAKGADETQLFSAYRELHSELVDARHLKSWFRDQVLHPHETQHTLREVAEWLAKDGFEVESTSINRFKPINNLEELYAEELKLRDTSYQRNVVEKRYYPGFFTVCAKRK